MTDSDEELDRKYLKINTLFPDLPFTPDLDHADVLDEPLIQSKSAIIFYPLKCICCCPDRDGAVVIPIKRNHFITYRDFYDECENFWWEELCNHQFLEGFEILTDTQITPAFGS